MYCFITVANLRRRQFFWKHKIVFCEAYFDLERDPDESVSAA